jgi:hypothetical protein
MGQGLDEIYDRKYPIPFSRETSEKQYGHMFHEMWAESLASEGFGKNLQQILMGCKILNSFPQLVHNFHNRAKSNKIIAPFTP